MNLSKIVKSNIEFLRPDLIDQLIKLEEESPFNLILMDSWWSCDCTKKELLRRKIKGLKAFCVAPKNLVGRNFNNLRSDDLKCKKTPSIWAADIKDTEYHPTNLSCAATGEKNVMIRPRVGTSFTGFARMKNDSIAKYPHYKY